MVMKRVPLFVLVLLGTAAAFSGVANAEEEDPRCQVQMCADGLTANNECRSSQEAWNCNDRCNSLGCDGGTQVGGSFSCVAGTSYKPFILCECSYCGGGGTGGDDDTGDGGGSSGSGGGCSDCLCDDSACYYDCWWAGWDWGECYLNECWCEGWNN